MAQTQALSRFLQSNPDAVPISDEARKAIAAAVEEPTGVELPPGMDEKWFCGFAAAETSGDLADVYHAHLQGDPKLNESFIEGVDKASKNPLHEAEAVNWYRKAAEQGYAKAQSNLGNMYSNGYGVPKDETAAYMWFLLAGAKGTEIARKAISIIETSLTSEQRAEGQRMAKDWKPTKAAGK
jgi:TPR repeat protein